jgi:ADP-ribose pyrophosphatase YjhB (NUDIX family)
MWSLPGGKLEMGEPALVGAQRELEEETAGWTEASIDLGRDIRWYPGTVYATDSIGDGYHYLIAQCFARLVLDSSSSTDRRRPPALQAADDAAAIGWFTRDEVHKLDREATSGVLQVIDRVEELDEKGLLPTG